MKHLILQQPKRVLQISTFSEAAHIFFADLRYILKKARSGTVPVTLPFSKCNANRQKIYGAALKL
jgi:hypothetical protein